MSDSPVLERLVDELRAGETGEIGEPGGFTLDASEAMRKLRELRFDNPLHWVLLVLRGAVRAHVSRIEVDEVPGGMRFSWPEVIELPHVDDAPGAALAGDADGHPGVRELILAAYVGLNAGLTEVRLESGGVGLRWDSTGVRPSGGPGGPGSEGTRLTVRGRLAPALDGERAELWVLRKRGRYLEVPLTVAGVRASFGHDEPVELPPIRGAVTRRHRMDPPAVAQWTTVERGEVRLLVDGVWVDTVRGEAWPDGFVAVVGGDMRLDAGHQRVVEDTARATALEAAAELRELATRTRAGLLRGEFSSEIQRRLADPDVDEDGDSDREEELGLSDLINALLALPIAVLIAISWAWQGAADPDLETGDLVLQFVLIVGAGVLGWAFYMSAFRELVDARRQARAVRSLLPPHHPARDLVPPRSAIARLRPTAVPVIVIVPLVVGMIDFGMSLGIVDLGAFGYALARAMVSPLIGLFVGMAVSISIRSEGPRWAPLEEREPPL